MLAAMYVYHPHWSNTAIVIAAVVVAFALAKAKKKRRLGRNPDGPAASQGACPGCGTANPVQANFCRRCGRALR